MTTWRSCVGSTRTGHTPSATWALEHDVLADQRAQQAEGTVDLVAERDDRRRDRLLARIREQLPHQCRTATGGLADLEQPIAHDAVRRMQQRHLDAADDHSEHVVVVVRDAACEPAERLDALRVGERFLQAALLRLRLAQPRDVEQHHEVRPRELRLETGRVRDDDAIGAVLGADRHLHRLERRAALARCHELAAPFLDDVAAIFRIGIRGRPPRLERRDVLARVPERPHELGIQVRDVVLVVVERVLCDR